MYYERPFWGSIIVLMSPKYTIFAMSNDFKVVRLKVLLIVSTFP